LSFSSKISDKFIELILSLQMNFFKKTYDKLINVFKQGLTPKQLALSLIVSIVISLFPIFGITTIVLTIVALKFKLNLPIMIILSYVIEPIKVLLLIPFIKVGGSIFGVTHKLLDLVSIKESFIKNSILETISSLSFELVCGFTGWILIVIPLSIPLYFLIKFILTLVMKNKIEKIN